MIINTTITATSICTLLLMGYSHCDYEYLTLWAESAEVLPKVSELLGTRLLQLSDVIDEENPSLGLGFKGFCGV